MINAGYRHNEWLVVYNDENGDRQVMPFDTKEQAIEYFNSISGYTNMIGVMTIWFYDHYVEKIVGEIQHGTE